MPSPRAPTARSPAPGPPNPPPSPGESPSVVPELDDQHDVVQPADLQHDAEPRQAWRPMIPGIDLDHVAIATEDRDTVWPRYAGELGGTWVSGGESAGFAAAQVRYANGMKVEVLEPWGVEQNDFLRRFLDRNG